jgi:molecular chaperone DnaK
MKKAIGIDLGTSNSVIAFKDISVRIYRNKENEELTRSCIGLRENEIIVGKIAYETLRKDPINTILSVKRLMGGAIKDKMVQDMIESPYYKFGIAALKGGTEDAVAVILGGKQYTPEQLSAEILKKLKIDAEEKLGDEVTHAVITVPAYFTDKQKNATRKAAQLAGLKVQKLLAEPTAAAIAYGVDNLKAGEAKTVMIYDFGGGTFDLSILNIVDGQYLEAGTGGDRWLGGDDLDRALQSHILNRISKDYNLSNIDKILENLKQTDRFKFEAKLREEVENIKMQLSSSMSAQLIMEGFKDESGDWIDFDLTITREEFEKLAKPFIERTIELIDNLLKEVGYNVSMIDNILLVGGTSCIPLIKQMLSKRYGSEKIKVSEKPMLAVAEGAGILSHRLGNEFEPIEEDGVIALGDIVHTTNHNYFIKLKDDYDRIVEKQMPLPYSSTKTYKTIVNNQQVVRIGIYANVEDGKMDKMTMGFYTIEEELPNGSEITFEFNLDLDEIFEVFAYPRGNKTQRRKIVLGRGGKDSKTLNFLADSLENIFSGDYTHTQQDFFIKSAKKEIQKINKIVVDDHDSEKWDEIGTAIFTNYERTSEITDSVDEDQLAILFATILINEYPELIDTEDTHRMKLFLAKVKNDDDPLEKIQSIQQLKKITEEYTILIALFTIKITYEKASKVNPSDGLRLVQLHDQIVNLLRNKRKDEAFKLLDEAINLRNIYGSGNINGIDIE